MNALSRTTKSVLGIVTLATGVAGMTGCSTNVEERRGSTTSKLLAPQAVFKGPATAETKAALGISEWRIYRGKTEYIVTGYDANGKAVKGVGLAFEGTTRSSKALLKARVLDGSRFHAKHEYGGATTASAALGSLSKSFVSHVVHDMTKLRMGLKTSITKSAVPTGEACSGDMVKIVINSLQCIATANASGSSLSKLAKVKQCVAAAQSASDAVESCKNAGTTDAEKPEKKPPSTTPAKAPSKAPAKAPSATPTKAPEKNTDTRKETDQKETDQEAADKKQDAEQDKEDDAKEAADKAADAKQDAEQDEADDTKADATTADDAKADADASEDATKASEDTTCTSCEGTGADDVKADETTGEVSKAEEEPAEAPEEEPAAEPAAEEPAAEPETGGESETTEA